VSIREAADDLVAALEAAGLRAAVRDGDITPPVVYLQIGTVSDAGAVLSGGTVVVFYVYYLPIRGIDNLAGDADALDAIYGALEPLAWAELAATRTSVTIKNETWPCYRLDVALMSAPAPEPAER
jgi:hypothetical protein